MSFWVKKWLPFIYGARQSLVAPRPIQVLDPYCHDEVRQVCHQFYTKYFGDDLVRVPILGINPGRLGAGITGISFTDPEKLKRCCAIDNQFEMKEELSSKFIYEWISLWGSVESFYKRFIILSVCPLGFIKAKKNINYYDEKMLQIRCEPLIVEQQKFIHQNKALSQKVYMLGKGKNYKYFDKLNKKMGWFGEVVPLPHPRWVMQYRYRIRYEIMDEMKMTLQNDYD